MSQRKKKTKPDTSFDEAMNESLRREMFAKHTDPKITDASHKIGWHMKPTGTRYKT
jgi:hypothetical protein